MTPLDFFGVQYGEDPLPGNLVITRFAPCSESEWCPTIEAAAEVCEQWAPESDVYYGIGLRGERPYAGARGDSSSVIALPGFGRDLDYGIKPTNDKIYPPTLEDALSLLDSLPVLPSMLVNAGACLHTYWLFKEVWDVTSAIEHHRAYRLSRGLSRLIEEKAAERGWCIDATFDLARVLRPVGTFNYQHGEPRAVTLRQHFPERRYIPVDFEPWEVPDYGENADDFAAGDFVIPSEPVPAEKLGAHFQACYYDPERPFFRQCWDRTKKVGDGSPSIYTFALGCRLFELGATSQELVDAMVTWRYRHGGDIDSHR